MGQEVRGVPEALEVADDPQGSIGRYLASQRRLRDISLDQLAALTKLPRRSLERLGPPEYQMRANPPHRRPPSFARRRRCGQRLAVKWVRINETWV